MMYGWQGSYVVENPPQGATLTRIFDCYAEESICDEDVKRILAPVQEMIMAGKFSKPRFRFGPARIMAAVFAVLTSIAFVAANSSQNGELVQISDTPTPLAGADAVGNALLGRVTVEERGVSGIEMQLVNVESKEIAGTVFTQDDGVYHFKHMPDGVYQLKATVASKTRQTESVDAGTWRIQGGKAELVFASDNDGQEGVDIWVCLSKN